MSNKGLFAYKVTVLSALILFLCALPAIASSSGDLLYYYTMALKNDPQLKGTEYETQASQETLRQAYSSLLPKIYGEVSYTLTEQRINNSDNQVYAAGATNYDSESYGVNLTLPIFHYSSFVSIGQARSIQSRAALELEKARQDLALRVLEAYMDVLLAKDKLAAVKSEEAAVELHHVRAKERFDKGLAPITDRYDTEARLAAVRAQTVEAENVLTDAFQALTEICGTSTQEIKPLRDELQLSQPFPAQMDQWIDAGLKQSPEVLIQKMKAEIADKEISRQRAGHYPTVDFLADYTNKQTKGSLFGGGSDTTTYDFIIKLSIPLYEGGTYTSKTREAANLYQSALQGVTRQQRAVERKVRSTYNGVISAITRVEAMKKSVDAQKMVVEAKEDGFKSGLYISLAVLDAMQDLFKYRKEYSQARNDYILNTFRLKHAVGTLRPEELRLINTWIQD